VEILIGKTREAGIKPVNPGGQIAKGGKALVTNGEVRANACLPAPRVGAKLRNK
jgi:hypothetical protein